MTVANYIICQIIYSIIFGYVIGRLIGKTVEDRVIYYLWAIKENEAYEELAKKYYNRVVNKMQGDE